MKKVIFLCLLTVMAITGCKQPSKDKYHWAEKMALSDINRNPEGWMIDFRRNRGPKWEYTHGLMMTSLMELYRQTGNKTYLNYIQNFADLFILSNGQILAYRQGDYNIDRVTPGRFLIDLYHETGDSILLPAIELLREQMRHHPRTSEGGFWHKQIYPYQIWLDGLYMGSPFLAKYASYFNEPGLFDDIANQFYLVDKHMYCPSTGLYYHGWDESRQMAWADSITGLSPGFWGRSIGWFAMGLVDAAYYYPVDHPRLADMTRIMQKVAEGVTRHQNPATGLWWQVPDQPGREGNYEEATATAMLSYFLLKGARLGYIDESYIEQGKKAYNGLLEHLIREEPDGTISLTMCVEVSGLGGNPFRDGSYEYYISEPIRDNDPKGVGPFILASLEMAHLNKK